MLFLNLLKSSPPITSFGKMELRISGMRGSHGYIVKHIENAVEICRYTIKYVDGEEARTTDWSREVPYGEFIDELNICHAGKWDGFHGKHPRGVLDGEQFTFELVTGDDHVIKADGSANFPDGLRDFIRWLDKQHVSAG